jgi:hypothetical protein
MAVTAHWRLPTLLTAGLLLIGRPAWGSHAIEIQLAPKPMAVLVAHLKDGGPGPKADLAWIAMTELIHSFETELDRAIEAPPSKPESRAKLRRWNAGTAGFVADLRARHAALERGASVALDTEPDGSLLVIVAGQPTVVSGPDIAHQRDLEARILESFCSIHPCPAPDESTDAPSGAEPSAFAPSLLAPEVGVWSFGDHRSVRYETSDGLAFEFPDSGNRPAREMACRNLAAELRQLLRALHQARDAGHSIDWRRLRVEQPPQGEDPRIVVNRQGAYMILPVPLLARQPVLVDHARPWLEARMADRPYLLILPGDAVVAAQRGR